MSDKSTSAKGPSRTLGLAGITVNAMALIAPGAFLWLAFQLQAGSGTHGSAQDMWAGIVLALVVAFLTALSFSELARRYGDGRSGGAYYYAERAVLERMPEGAPLARVIKFVTGWASHLFYWVYPGVMVGFMATLVSYIVSQYSPTTVVPLPFRMAIAWLFAALVGTIAVRGITGSTKLSIIINVVQLVSLLFFGGLAIYFRVANPLGVPADGWFHGSALSVIMPHSLSGLLYQAVLAMIILVGFESAAAYGAEAKNPRRDIPRAIVLSLLLQGVLAYLFEYFATNYAMGDWLVSADGGAVSMAAAATSRAPIGDMAIAIGNALLANNGFALMVFVSITVAIALLGTALSAMNTGVRISFAMAQDEEMPAAMSFLHGKFATPYIGIILMVLVSGLIGSIGVAGGSVTLLGITLASNLGTFCLYMLVCGLTYWASRGQKGFKFWRHGVVPLAGLVLNLLMAVGLLIIGLSAGGDTTRSAVIAIVIAVVWFLVSGLYLYRSTRKTAAGRAEE